MVVHQRRQEKGKDEVGKVGKKKKSSPSISVGVLKQCLLLIVVAVTANKVFSLASFQDTTQDASQDTSRNTRSQDVDDSNEADAKLNCNNDMCKSDTPVTQTSLKGKENMCSVYLAPSSVPGGGMGMFTVEKVKKGGMILPADGPSIPIIDYDTSQKSLDTWVDLFSGYWWENGISDHALFEAKGAAEYQITCGALPNSHPYLNNLDIGHPAVVPYDDSILDRTTDPGAGAISYYMGRDTIAYADMEAGEEIFLQYPDGYMNYISEKYGIPKHADYKEAGRAFSSLLDKHGYQLSDWNIKDLSSSVSEKALSLLPKTQNDLERVLAVIDNHQDTAQVELAIAKEMSVEKRSVPWIREHGICLDNIIPGMSTNPRAGKGAIAQRSMAKGDVIAPASLLQITNRDALQMPAFEGGNEWQLLLNYCLGRDDSSLLLCPNTNTVLVNHCSERRPDIHPCGNEDTTPNAQYRWAKWDGATDAWLHKTIEQMEKDGGRGLSLELVAMRSINEGEEVFIDYGISWEKAWDEHITNWKPAPQDENKNQDKWKSAKELNDELAPLEVAPNLSAEHKTVDSRGILFTGCHYYEYEDDEDLWDSFDPDDSWKDMSTNEVIKRYAVDYGDEYNVDEKIAYSDGSFWPCVVIARDTSESDEDDGDSYTVRILQSEHFTATKWQEMDLPRIILNYKRSSIRHFYLPYKSDIHLPGVFRHHIELPDNLVQSIWKDRE